MIKRIINSFLDSLVEVVPLCACSYLAGIFVSTVLGLSMNMPDFPIILFYLISMLLFAVFFLSIKVFKEVKNKTDCYMQAAVAGTYLGYLNCEIFKEGGLLENLISNPYWDYKITFFAAATVWHALIMAALLSNLKKRKAASVKMQPV